MAINKRLIKSNDEGGGAASFNTVLWTGDYSATRQITGVGFQPDLVWLKGRNASWSHFLQDSIRGAENFLTSQDTIAEATTTPHIVDSFDADGFTIKGNGNSNATGDTYVAWCWKAGGSAVTNTDGTITSQVSANVEAGFSIVSWTGNGAANATVGHGLNNTPSLYITKRRDSTGNWVLFATTLLPSSNQQFLVLNDSAAAVNGASQPLPNSSILNVQSVFDNINSATYVSYCFAEVAGFSKFGSYVAPGGLINIDCGFEPAFVMIKAASNLTSGFESYRSWGIYDNKRNMTGNTTTNPLWANQSFGEGTRGNGDVQPDVLNLTFEPNGFSIPISNAESNGFEGETYIYMAFANQF